MCIALYASVPLQIQYLQEQIWVVPGPEGFKVQECYDLVFTNQGSKKVNSLQLVSPHFLFNQEKDNSDSTPLIIVPHLTDETYSHLNWYMEEEPTEEFVFADDHIGFSVPCYYKPGVEAGYRRHECVVVRGDPRFDRILKKATEETWKYFLDLKCTVAEIIFYDEIEPYQKSQKTYWTRIILEPHTLNHRVEPRELSLGDNFSNLLVQPCEVLAPALVLSNLRDQLSDENKGDDESEISYKIREKFKQSWIIDGFDREDHVAWIQDHRISVVTGKECLVVDSQMNGSVAFLMVKPAGNMKVHARLWQAGAQHFPNEDPFIVSKKVYEYLKDCATRSVPEKSIREIAHETQIFMPSVEFVVCALQKETILLCTDNGSEFFLNSEYKDDIETLFSRENQVPLRKIMARPQERKEMKIHFPGRPFVVQFDIVWVSQGLTRSNNKENFQKESIKQEKGEKLKSV